MGRPADIIIAGCKVRPAELQHIALGIGVDETVSFARIVEFMDMARRESQAGKQLLCESAVILQPVAEGASADDLEAIGAQGILQGAETFRDAFEQDHAIPARGADPIQFGPPVVHPLYQARKGAMGFGIADRDLDLMPLILEAEVERAQIAGFSHAQEMHQPRSNIAAINAMRSTSA